MGIKPPGDRRRTVPIGSAEQRYRELTGQDERLRHNRTDLSHLYRLAGLTPPLTPAEELYLEGIRAKEGDYSDVEVDEILASYQEMSRSTKRAYTIVFLIDRNNKLMALIRSNLGKGDHLDHTINGVGGKYDATVDSSIKQSAIRETSEETGLSLDEDSVAPLALLHNDEEESWLCYFVGLVDDLDVIAGHEDREGTILVGSRLDLANALADLMLEQSTPQMALNPASRLLGLVPDFFPSDDERWPPSKHPLLIGHMEEGLEPPKFVNPERWPAGIEEYRKLYESILADVEDQLAQNLN